MVVMLESSNQRKVLSMKKCVSYRSLAALGLSAVLSLACHAMAAEGIDKGLLFYAPMDGSAKATVSAGDAAPKIEKGLTFVEGKFGKAVEIKGEAVLRYAGGKNFNFASGTIAMWVKRDKPWKASPFVLFKGWADNWNQNSMFIQTTEYAQLRVWIWNADNKQATVRSPNGIPYEADRWYHLAVTFEDGAVKIYMDGKEISYGVASNPTLEMPTAALKAFDIGSEPKFVLDGAIDELRIYDHPLGADAVEQLVNHKPEN
jgi:hypothetical protein